MKISTIALWGLRIIVALAFAAAALAKLLGQPMMVHEFGQLGLGQWFRFFTAGVELVSAGLMLNSRTSRLGALGLFGVCVGALVAQVGVLHGDLVHVFVLMTASGILAWAGGGWPRLPASPAAKPAG
jgi:putative oxidoreductase